MPHTYTALVTLLTVVLILWFMMKVGKERGTAIKAPATTGTAEFDRAFRVHMNTIEQVVMFLPSLWLALPVLGDIYTAAIGGVWLVGRTMFAFAYWKDPDSRSTGFMISFLALVALLIPALYGVVTTLL